METTSFAELEDNLLMTEQNCTWLPTSLMVPAQLTHADGESTRCEIDLVEYIGKDSKYAKLLKDPLIRASGHKNPRVFPDFSDDSKETQMAIKTHFSQVGAQDGYKIMRRGYDPKTTKLLVINCKRGKKSQNSTTKTARPLDNEHLCPFRIPLKYSDGQWTISTGTGNLQHSGHSRLDETMLVDDVLREERGKTVAEWTAGYERWRKTSTDSSVSQFMDRDL
ncbi:hypothetical protein FisN_2Hu132 [Fistulifera solaris]|uniref:Uncharacterized protein n=1 Tax=Fistulifera solaris TaxID=1519565 RepID=A0A1Z5KP42_FISSO|nr:hypothetical protein FisN_2Hu132 [Fistulifera solaris]|eukprot:GAX28049.1 hypothetical protein FisN_2Hu132 [Fistulifera solaris]